MKIALITVSLLIAASIIVLFILGVISRSGKAPGLVDGHLSRCSHKPNCVCSEHKDDIRHYVDPIIIPENIASDTVTVLKNVLLDMGGSIQAESDNYLSSTFSSSIFGFVDDLEIRIDSVQKVVHIRSASRVGYGDGGVNKKRTELLKKLYNKEVSETNRSLDVTPESGAQ